MTRSTLWLVVIGAAYVIAASRYALETPLWQVPDEPAHYNYVAQVSVSPLAPPVIGSGDYPFAYLEALKAAHFPPSMPITGIAYEDHQPPLYYYLAAVVYRLADGEPAHRARAIRLLGVALGLALVWIAWRVVHLGWPEDKALALATAAFVAFLPMQLTFTAGVNNDPLANLVAAAALWWGLGYAIGHRSRHSFALGGGLLLGIALLTKVTIYAPVVAVLVGAAVLAHWSRARSTWRTATVTAGAILGLGLLIALPWFARNARVYGLGDPFGLRAHNAVVAGQPRTADWIAEHGLDGLLQRMAIFTFDSFWGVFGWMGEFLDQRIYLGLAILTALSLIGMLHAWWRLARANGGLSARHRALLVLSTLAVLAVVGNFAFYNLTFVQHQGRYLFGALVPIALLFLLGLREVGYWAGGLIDGAGSGAGRPGPWARRMAFLVLGGFSVGLAALALASLYRYIIPHLG